MDNNTVVGDTIKPSAFHAWSNPLFVTEPNEQRLHQQHHDKAYFVDILNVPAKKQRLHLSELVINHDYYRQQPLKTLDPVPPVEDKEWLSLLVDEIQSNDVERATSQQQPPELDLLRDTNSRSPVSPTFEDTMALGSDYSVELGSDEKFNVLAPWKDLLFSGDKYVFECIVFNFRLIHCYLNIAC